MDRHRVRQNIAGLVSSTDQQHVDAFLNRSKCCGFCRSDLLTFGELLEEADEKLFEKIHGNPQHVFYMVHGQQHCKPTTCDKRAHDRLKPARTGHLTDSNFITRLIYKDAYEQINAFFILTLNVRLFLYYCMTALAYVILVISVLVKQ